MKIYKVVLCDENHYWEEALIKAKSKRAVEAAMGNGPWHRVFYGFVVDEADSYDLGSMDVRTLDGELV